MRHYFSAVFNVFSKNMGYKRLPSLPSEKFNYNRIPTGHYDYVVRRGHPVRRAWHLQKFSRIADCLPVENGGSILDVGCFAGSFLSLLPESRFGRQLGIDILPNQIEFAAQVYGTEFRRFRAVKDVREIQKIGERFDYVTLIEVIEHLKEAEIVDLFNSLEVVLKPGGMLILSTPNYFSMWPFIEFVLNRISDVSYEEQHLTKFRYWSIERRFAEIIPNFHKRFDFVSKTTTHFISPFLACASLGLAAKVSSMVNHRTWRFPFGNLVMVTIRKRSFS